VGNSCQDARRVTGQTKKSPIDLEGWTRVGSKTVCSLDPWGIRTALTVQGPCPLSRVTPRFDSVETLLRITNKAPQHGFVCESQRRPPRPTYKFSDITGKTQTLLTCTTSEFDLPTISSSVHGGKHDNLLLPWKYPIVSDIYQFMDSQDDRSIMQ